MTARQASYLAAPPTESSPMETMALIWTLLPNLLWQVVQFSLLHVQDFKHWMSFFVVVMTDASLRGWGALQNGRSVSGIWSGRFLTAEAQGFSIGRSSV